MKKRKRANQRKAAKEKMKYIKSRTSDNGPQFLKP